MAQAKLQAAFSDPDLRRALRIVLPNEAPLESVVADRHARLGLRRNTKERMAYSLAP